MATHNPKTTRLQPAQRRLAGSVTSNPHPAEIAEETCALGKTLEWMSKWRAIHRLNRRRKVTM
jgi:hypothetical protein